MNNKKIKRDEFSIYYEVLVNLSKNPMKAAQIMRLCNLDTRLYKHVMSILMSRGLVNHKTLNGEKLYHTTDKGLKFIEYYESIQSLIPTQKCPRKIHNSGSW